MTALGMLVPLSAAAFSATDEKSVLNAAAERLMDAVWVRDLPCVPDGDTDAGQGTDPFMYISRLAQNAPNMTFGTAVVIGGVRHPLVLARQAVSAQHYTSNRFILGIGTGGKPAMSHALGVDAVSPDQFVSSWTEVSAALNGNVSEGLTFSTPARYQPPPMWLATSKIDYWNRLENQIQGWMTGFVAPQPFRSLLERLQRTQEQNLEVAMRLAVDVRDDNDAPNKPQSDGGYMVLSKTHLTSIFSAYRNLPIDHLITSVRDDCDLEKWRAVAACWRRTG